MAFRTLLESDHQANASRPISRTTCNVLTTSVPIKSLTSIPKHAVYIEMMRRVVWMVRLFPVGLWLLSIMLHNTHASFHLCFLCAAKVHSESSVHFLLLSLRPVCKQVSCSSLASLKDSSSASHLYLGKFWKKLVLPRTQFCKTIQLSFQVVITIFFSSP